MIFVGPLLVAIFLYSIRDNLSFGEPTSYGELIHPAQPIKTIEIQDNANQKLDIEYIKGKWSYLIFAGPNCDLICEAGLFKVRQAKLATGKDVNRVQYFLVLDETQTNAVAADLLDRHPLLTSGKLLKWQTEVKASEQEKLVPGYIYLVDPFGNVMMRYSPESTSKGMYKDIKKLLKISNIG